MSNVQEQFLDAYDRLMAAREVVPLIDKAAKDILAHAEPVLALMVLGRIPADGELIRDVEINIARVQSDMDLSHKSLAAAEKSAGDCSTALSRLDLYGRVSPVDAEIAKRYDELERALRYLSASVIEIRALHAQMEGSVASLEQMLPL